MKEYPNYYSITPATVRYDNRLKPNEKLLFGEITALSNIKGYCYSTNKYFSKLYDVATPTVSKWINHLKELGYIKVEMIKEGKEIKERHLFPVVDPINKKINTPINEKVNSPINKKVKENNTSINNTRINKSSSTATTDQNAFELYQIVVGILTPMQSQNLSEYIRELSDDVVKFAINAMANQTEQRSFNYLNRILMKYEQLGINTVEKAEALEKEHQAKKKPKKKAVKRQSKPSEEWGGW
ncbi:DnaD domain protein [Ligilactobacillus sp. 110_WCHN]|uniref:DnaD domain protein n=1 Tax=Ligilactobacillus sp. 110_WCHN TaxID=3057125 RepID=UPI0026739F48|nr:DnaD domain protein [Ligilactobacillus sp. 110_WCHN]MDO3393564.1 helix-turn-helix domain-containing protein [Ligilactobacillus sp. 110_WCHN]